MRLRVFAKELVHVQLFVGLSSAQASGVILMLHACEKIINSVLSLDADVKALRVAAAQGMMLYFVVMFGLVRGSVPWHEAAC